MASEALGLGLRVEGERFLAEKGLRPYVPQVLLELEGSLVPLVLGAPIGAERAARKILDAVRRLGLGGG